mgnify:CR=1 FL=1
MNDLNLLGSEEWCQFDDLSIPAIKARIDSGAKTSSIQASKIKIFEKDLEKWVRFEVYPVQENRSISVLCQAKVEDVRQVKSSQGVAEKRPVIKTKVQIADQSFEIELTLANRETMEYRMLLGREAINGRYLVDPSKSFCQGDYTEEELKEKYSDKIKPKTGLTIGILASNPELYSNKRIIGVANVHRETIINDQISNNSIERNRHNLRLFCLDLRLTQDSHGYLNDGGRA